MFQRGFVDHQAGRLPQAEAAYRQVLTLDPRHADAWHLLGLIAHQFGRNEAAADCIRRAIALKRSDPVYRINLGAVLCTLGEPAEAEASCREALRLRRNDPAAYNNLGTALRDLGRLAEAEASYREALRLQPSYPDALNNLGVVLRDLGRLEESVASSREALRYRPDHPEAHNTLGNALRDLGRPDEAARSYREALRLRPVYPEAHNNLGIVLCELGNPIAGEASCRDALRLRPDYPDAHNNLGNALRDLGRLAEAEASFREALHLRPDYPEAHNNLAVALRDAGRMAEAEAGWREALRLRPSYPEAHNNLGNVLRDLGRLVESEASCREALRLRPDYPEAHVNLSHVLLTGGRFEEGWREYEARWTIKSMLPGVRDFPAPLWSGEAIGGRTILLHSEQGFGDTLHFCRYVRLIAAAGIVLEIPEPLVRLLSHLPGVSQVVARGDALPPFDLHCPLVSLPLAFGTTLDTVPAATPYLAADPALAAPWRDKLAAIDGLRVGLVWAGGSEIDVDSRRSIALETMAPLAEIPGVGFVSLQKDAPAAQSANPPNGMVLHDFTADLHDFADTAALIDALDLVISVDTAVAHLAGALGKPVWLLNRFDADWRWLRERDDSPWYPTMRQFRQPELGDWRSVMRSVRDALGGLAAGGTR